MAVSKRPGGLYLGPDGETHVDANGKPVDAKEVKKALKQPAAAAPAPGGQSTPQQSTTDEKKGPLPEDFPHRAILEAAGITSYGKLRDADLSTVEGIGPARQAEIEAALKG